MGWQTAFPPAVLRTGTSGWCDRSLHSRRSDHRCLQTAPAARARRMAIRAVQHERESVRQKWEGACQYELRTVSSESPEKELLVRTSLRATRSTPGWSTATGPWRYIPVSGTGTTTDARYRRHRKLLAPIIFMTPTQRMRFRTEKTLDIIRISSKRYAYSAVDIQAC